MPRLSFVPGFSLIAATMVLAAVPAGVGLAQTAPSTGAAPAATAPATTAATAKPAKKKAAKKMTRQQEIDRSIDSGTVPARYRRSVPKEYHHLIPFDKR